MYGALPYAAYTGMCFPRWTYTYYFNSLVVSTIHSHKKLWVGLSQIYLFTNAWTGECPIVCSQDYPTAIIIHIYPFSIQFLHQTTDSFGLSITQFVKYGWNVVFCEPDTLHVISNWSCHRQQNNEHTFRKVSPANLAVVSSLPLYCVHVSQSVLF